MSDVLTLEHLKTLISNQQEKIKNLEQRVAAAEKQAESAEQYSRLDCLILRGRLDIRPNASIREEVMRLIAFHTGVRFPSWCLNTVHWLGGGKSLIVRFNNKAVRDEVYRNRVPKEAEKRGLFIHESLTPAKMALVSKCAVMRKQGSITTYYTQGGNVMIRKTKGSPSIMVTPGMSVSDILEMLQNQPTSYREAVTHGAEREGEQTISEKATMGKTQTENKKEKDGENMKNTEEGEKTNKETGQAQTREAEKTEDPSTTQKVHATQETKPSEKEEVSTDVVVMDNRKEKQTEEQSKKVKTRDSKSDSKVAQHVVTEMPEPSESVSVNVDQEDSSTEVEESPSKSPSKQRKSKRRRNQQKGKK